MSRPRRKAAPFPSLTPDPVARMRELERILRRASPLLLEGFHVAPGADANRRARLGTKQKSSHRDLVTVYDQRVEAFVTESLARVFPGETIIGEEAVSASGRPARELCEKHDAFWLIDPIDGTTNYSKAYPFFASTAAFAARAGRGTHEVLAAATWDPTREEMFAAAKDGGAWLNRLRLSVTSVRRPEQALLATGFASTRASSKRTLAFARFEKLTKLTLGVRRDGAASLDLAYVACGRTDAYWESSLSPWDTAAGILLVQEAGGKVTHLDGKRAELLSGEVLSSNAFLHKWLQNELEAGQRSSRRKKNR